MHVLIDLLYETLYWLLGMLLVFTHSLRVSGTRRVPKTGPVLLIANHQSYMDIVPLGLAARRRIYYLAKLPLFQSKILAAIMRFFGTVAVDNEGFSRAGLEGILGCLKERKMVLVFPEGERCWDGKLAELKPGVTLVIKKAKVPIVPIALAGAFDAWPRTRRWMHFAPPFFGWRRERIAVVVGEPLDGALVAELPREEMLKKLTLELTKVVAQAERLRNSGRG
jgi:1-acyl-sn-glycerol-3-phosphate acyltransferase